MLLIIFHGFGRSAIGVWTWSNIFGLDGMEYNEFRDYRSSRIFNRRVSLLILLMLAFNGIRHSLVTGHHQP